MSERADQRGEGEGAGRVVAGRYRLLERLGAGAHSSVYRATSDEPPEEVAVKVLHTFVTDPKLAAERLFREARLIARLDHPGCVRLVDWGVDGTTPYLVLELVRGESLRLALIREKRFATERAAALGVQVCKALEAAHGLGIVHRDLKPENIMLVADETGGKDRVKVLDFGIARLLPADEPEETLPRELTVPGAVLGTPCYMAPEQLRRPDVDERADIYACGVVLYEMLAGDVPIDAGNPIATILALASRPPRPLGELLPEVDAELEALIMRCLEKDPAARWQHIREVGTALAQWVRPRQGGAARRERKGAVPLAELRARLALEDTSDTTVDLAQVVTTELDMPTKKLPRATREVVEAYRHPTLSDEVRTVPKARGASRPEAPEAEAVTATLPKRKRASTVRMSDEQVEAANEADRQSLREAESAAESAAEGAWAPVPEEPAPEPSTVRILPPVPTPPPRALDPDLLRVSPRRSMLGVGALVLTTLLAVVLAWWIWR